MVASPLQEPLIDVNLGENSQVGAENPEHSLLSYSPDGKFHDNDNDSHSSRHDTSNSETHTHAPPLEEDGLLSTLIFVSGNMLELYDVSVIII